MNETPSTPTPASISDSPAPELKTASKGKKPLIIVLVAAGVGILVLAAVGYFAVLPSMQVSAYKKSAESKHQQVNDKLLRVYDSFKRGAFTNVDSTPEADKLDVQVARDAIKDVEDALSANNQAMTGFSAWPLLHWNQAYRQASATDAAEEAYVQQVRAFLTEYQALLAYADVSLNIAIKMEAALKDLERVEIQTSATAMANLIDTSIVKLQPLTAELSALAPPSYLKANSDAGLGVFNKLITAMKDLSAGARTSNESKVTKAAEDVYAQSDKLDKLSKEFVNILQHQSPIQGQISQLRAKHSEVVAGYGKL